MRDIQDRRTSALEQEEADSGWWIKGLFFVVAVLMTLAHFGVQRSMALERAAIGERTKALGELIQETKRIDKLKEEDYEKTRAQELSRIVDYSDKDREGLVAIIEGAK